MQSPGPALPLLIRFCLTRRSHLPFLVFQNPKHVGSEPQTCGYFLMRAMIALVGVVEPSLAEENQQWLLSNT